MLNNLLHGHRAYTDKIYYAHVDALNFSSPPMFDLGNK